MKSKNTIYLLLYSSIILVLFSYCKGYKEKKDRTVSSFCAPKEKLNTIELLLSKSINNKYLLPYYFLDTSDSLPINIQFSDDKYLKEISNELCCSNHAVNFSREFTSGTNLNIEIFENQNNVIKIIIEHKAESITGVFVYRKHEDGTWNLESEELSTCGKPL